VSRHSNSEKEATPDEKTLGKRPADAPWRPKKRLSRERMAEMRDMHAKVCF
jgi:hypothetical protein